jgi:phospholipid transport system transporter-binding protein
MILRAAPLRAPDGGFVAARDGWTYAGALTFANATPVYEACAALPLPTAASVDLSGLGQADSTALAVMLALKRRAAREGKTIAFAAVPAGILRLARVYGVEDLLAG